MTKRKDSSQTSIRRNHKDSLFRMIFGDREGALELYNALNHSSYDDPDLLEITTIDDVIFMGMKNDLSFLIEGQMNLYEAQSTWSPNMPLRGLFYFSSLYQGYVEKRRLDIYSHVRLMLPRPIYLIFYNGSRDIPEQTELRLSESFAGAQKDAMLEVIARVLNVNYGHNKELLSQCRRLHDYAYLIQTIRSYSGQGLSLEAAVDMAVKTCIERDILKDFLLKHRGEVCNVILTEYNAEFHIQNEKQLSYEEGKEEGKVEGKEEGKEEERRKFVQNMLREGLDVKKIMLLADITQEEAERYMTDR